MFALLLGRYFFVTSLGKRYANDFLVVTGEYTFGGSVQDEFLFRAKSPSPLFRSCQAFLSGQALVLWATSIAAHHDNARHEFTDDFDQVRLGCHHVVNVLVSAGYFIEAPG